MPSTGYLSERIPKQNCCNAQHFQGLRRSCGVDDTFTGHRSLAQHLHRSHEQGACLVYITNTDCNAQLSRAATAAAGYNDILTGHRSLAQNLHRSHEEGACPNSHHKQKCRDAQHLSGPMWCAARWRRSRFLDPTPQRPSSVSASHQGVAAAQLLPQHPARCETPELLLRRNLRIGLAGRGVAAARHQCRCQQEHRLLPPQRPAPCHIAL